MKNLTSETEFEKLAHGAMMTGSLDTNVHNKYIKEKEHILSCSSDDVMHIARDLGLAPNWKSEDEKRAERLDEIRHLVVCDWMSIININTT